MWIFLVACRRLEIVWCVQVHLAFAQSDHRVISATFLTGKLKITELQSPETNFTRTFRYSMWIWNERKHEKTIETNTNNSDNKSNIAVKNLSECFGCSSLELFRAIECRIKIAIYDGNLAPKSGSVQPGQARYFIKDNFWLWYDFTISGLYLFKFLLYNKINSSGCSKS